MKIIYYSPHPHLNLMSPTGFGTHMREMITAFRNMECEVKTIIMGGEENPPKEALDQRSTGMKELLKRLVSKKIWRTLKDIDLIRFDYSKASRRLEKAIQTFQPDCIYERCNYLQLSGIRMANKYGLTHIMEINSPYVDENISLSEGRSYFDRYARRVEGKQALETDIALATVGPLKEYFCKRYGVKSDTFIITHDAFNKDNIKLNAENQQDIINEYGLKDKVVIGFIGSIFKWHGLDKLIKALDELGRPDVKLLIVGYGEYMTHLIELTKTLNREEDVIFTGRVPKEEVFDYINVMDICAAPAAAWYQSPVKIFEYGAMGKPIIGPDTDAVREVMESGKDGILVKPTIEGVRQGVQMVLGNREKAAEMGRRFQQKVLNDYTWDRNAQKVLRAIQSS